MISYDEIKRRSAGVDPERAARRARWFLLGSTALTLLLYVAPYYVAEAWYVSLPLVWISTLVHELAHGFTAALLGGRFHKFVMHPDASGAATWSGNFGPLRTAMVAAGGLVGPPVFAAVAFFIARKANWAKWALYVGTIGLVLIAALIVRNPFGLGFVAVFTLIIGLLASRPNPEVSQITLVFLATQMTLAVFSRGDYLFTEYAETANGRMPSDVAQVANALGGPYWLWGGIIGVTSVLLLGLGLWLFFRDFDDFSVRGLFAARKARKAAKAKAS